jgi:hypothetical protein
VTRQARKTADSARKEVGRRARQAGDSGGELLSATRFVLHDLRKGARDIADTTRDERRKAARDSIKAARRAARRARSSLR